MSNTLLVPRKSGATGRTNGLQPGHPPSIAGLRMDTLIQMACRPTRAMTKAQLKKRSTRTSVAPLLDEPEFQELRYLPKLPSGDIPGGKGACKPDGGALYYGNLLIAAIEGKTQGWGGNAIERYCDNREIMRFAHPVTSYITLCSGVGTLSGGPIDNLVIRELAKEGLPTEWDRFNLGGSSFFRFHEGTFDVEDLNDLLRPILRKILNSIDVLRQVDRVRRDLQHEMRQTYRSVA